MYTVYNFIIAELQLPTGYTQLPAYPAFPAYDAVTYVAGYARSCQTLDKSGMLMPEGSL